MRRRARGYARLGDRETLAALIAADPGVAGLDAVFMGAVDFRHHALVQWLLAQARTSTRARPRGPATRPCTPRRGTATWRWCAARRAGADLTARDEEYDGTPPVGRDGDRSDEQSEMQGGRRLPLGPGPHLTVAPLR